MTLAEFLAWEERQELRYEFDGLAPVAMTGGNRRPRPDHLQHKKSVGRSVGWQSLPAIRSKGAGRARYPDALVTCVRVDPAATVVDDPVVVFEVISDDTARTDPIEKLREYQATASIRHYVILEQKSIGAMAFYRKGEDWVVAALTENDSIDLPEIGIAIPMTELYTGLRLSPLEETRSEPG